jgi:hypothetical protein
MASLVFPDNHVNQTPPPIKDQSECTIFVRRRGRRRVVERYYELTMSGMDPALHPRAKKGFLKPKGQPAQAVPENRGVRYVY